MVGQCSKQCPGPELRSPQGIKSSAEHEVEMMHLAEEFSASNHAQAASLMVTVLTTSKPCLGVFQSLSLKMPHVQGSPSSISLPQGKTAAAVALSKYYGAACLSIDAVVTEAISDKSSSAGLRARELCIRAAIEQSRKETEESGNEKC